MLAQQLRKGRGLRENLREDREKFMFSRGGIAKASSMMRLMRAFHDW